MISFRRKLFASPQDQQKSQQVMQKHQMIANNNKAMQQQISQRAAQVHQRTIMKLNQDKQRMAIKQAEVAAKRTTEGNKAIAKLISSKQKSQAELSKNVKLYKTPAKIVEPVSVTKKIK